MREYYYNLKDLKFRAYYEKNNSMMYSDKLDDENKLYPESMVFFFETASELNMPVMKGTGVNDETEEEIYQGDILLWKDRDKEERWLVVEEDGSFKIKSLFKTDVASNTILDILFSRRAKYLKIIGNMFQNKELL